MTIKRYFTLEYKLLKNYCITNTLSGRQWYFCDGFIPGATASSLGFDLTRLNICCIEKVFVSLP